MYDELGRMIVLTDFTFWSRHFDELVTWCSENGGEVNGSTVLFRHDHELTAFVLRWS